MKDLAVKIVTFVLGAGLIAYVVWLWMNNLPVVSGLQHLTTIALIVTLLVGVGLLIAVFKPSLLPQNRRTIAVCGIILIFLAHTHLSDDPTRYIFLQDVIKVIGVYLIIVGPMKLLIPKKVQQEIEEKDVEIIEV